MIKIVAIVGGGIGGSLGYFVAETFPGGASWALLGAVLGLTLIAYIAAAVAVSQAAVPVAVPTADGMRYLLIGLNAGLNIAFGIALYGAAFGIAVGIILSGVIGVVNLLAIFEPITRSEFFQGVIGWLNWLMPMSWLIVALGIGFLIFNALGGLFVGLIGRVAYCKIHGMRVDWKTGTIFTRGGFVSNLNFRDTAFNMGNFSYVDMNSPDWHIEHEAGHTLNLAAFGSIFHLIGAIDENVTGGGERAFSERLAESNVPGTSLSGIIIPMWA